MIPVIAVSDKRPEAPYYIYDAFFESLDRLGTTPVILGYGEPYKGMMSRLRLPLEYMCTISDEHVILTDCWDVLFLRSPEDIIQRFKEFGKPIVISAERTLFPEKDYGQYPESPNDVRYLNAGFIVAEREALISLFDHLRIDAQPDDFQREDGSWQHFSEQELLHHAYVEQFIPIALDHDSEICQNMFRTLGGEICFTADGVVNTVTNSHPMVLHWNGPAKTEAWVLPQDGVKWWKGSGVLGKNKYLGIINEA